MGIRYIHNTLEELYSSMDCGCLFSFSSNTCSGFTLSCSDSRCSFCNSSTAFIALESFFCFSIIASLLILQASEFLFWLDKIDI